MLEVIMDITKLWQIIDETKVSFQHEDNWLLKAEITDDIMEKLIQTVGRMINLIVRADVNLCKKTNAIINFTVKISQDQFVETKLEATADGEVSKPKEITLHMDADTFLLLLCGKQEGAGAFMNGKIRMTGSGGIPVALKLQSILNQKLGDARKGILLNDLKASL